MDPFLNQIIAADAAFALDALGETVHMQATDGTTRTISAVVNRNPVMQMDDGGRKNRPSILLTCSTDAIKGIDPTADPRGVKVLIANPVGAPLQGYSISQRITDQSPGQWTVLLT